GGSPRRHDEGGALRPRARQEHVGELGDRRRPGNEPLLRSIAAPFANDSRDRLSRLEITNLHSIRAVFAPSFRFDSGSIRDGFANGFASKKSFGVVRRRERAPRTVRESFP